MGSEAGKEGDPGGWWKKRGQEGKGTSTTVCYRNVEAAIVDQHGAQLRGRVKGLSIQKGAPRSSWNRLENVNRTDVSLDR